MRINEKSLAQFANSGAPADKEGYLEKKGELNKGFQKRWFKLKGNLLFYYEKRADKEPVGVVVLEGCTVELTSDSDGFNFQIIYPGSGCRTYVLKAQTQEDMEAWMKVLSSASYDYMKVLVTELQRQLEEVESNSQKKLVADAVHDSRIISQSYTPDLLNLESFTNTTPTSVDHRHDRFNPFNSVATNAPLVPLLDLDEATNADPHLVIDFDDNNNSGNNSRVRQRTFIEMHEEFGMQIRQISEKWKRRLPLK